MQCSMIGLVPPWGEVRNIDVEARQRKRQARQASVIRRTDTAWELEADPRHAERIIQHLDLKDAMSVSNSGVDQPVASPEEIEDKSLGLAEQDYRGYGGEVQLPTAGQT